MLKEMEARSWSLQSKVARKMMDAAGTVLTPQRVRACRGDGPSADGCGVAVPAQNCNREENEPGKK